MALKLLSETMGSGLVLAQQECWKKLVELGQSLKLGPLSIHSNIDVFRDSSVKLSYTLVSESSYSNRHSLRITWSKAQDPLASDPPPEIEYTSAPKAQSFAMISISTPDAKQSEAYIATMALFLIFGSSAKEDKVFLRLPATWRDLWTELAEKKKERLDETDRASVRKFRNMVREKRDQEMEDGVLIQGAFRNRGTRAPDNSDESGPDKSSKSHVTSEAYQKIWADKSSSPSYQMMLVRYLKLICGFLLTNASNPVCSSQCGALKTKFFMQSIANR
jgi:ATP-dependent RNA helicase DHX29